MAEADCVAPFRARFMRAHSASLAAAGITVAAMMVFAFGRFASGQHPTPAVRSTELPVQLDTPRCDCRCEGSLGDLVCAGDLHGGAPGAVQEGCSEAFGDGTGGIAYRGCQTRTRSGRECQRWDAQAPHVHAMTPENYPDADLRENYCRNPNGEATIWCYTADPLYRWDLCDPARSGPEWTPAAMNVSGCLRQPLAWSTPSFAIPNCSCGGVARADVELAQCRVTFAYSAGSVQYSVATSAVLVLLAVAALAFDLQYLVAIYFAVLPNVPKDIVSSEWMMHWLQRYQDPLHSAAIWTVWCSALAVGFSPPGDMQNPFPSLRDFTPEDVREAAGWGPTGLDELILWISVLALGVTMLMLVCGRHGAGIGPGGVFGEQSPALDQPPPWLSRGCFVCLLALASFGLLLGQPINCVYAFIVTVPLCLMQLVNAFHSSWPLERPLPSFRPPWDLPESTARQLEEALVLLKSFEAQHGPDSGSRRLGFGLGARVRNLCRPIHDLWKAQPWRVPVQLEVELQSTTLSGLENAIRLRSPELLHEYLRCADMLGYCPPPREGEEDDVGAPQRLWDCICLPGYKRFGGAAPGDRPLVRDEAWNGSVHRALVAALGAAVDSAGAGAEACPHRWLGATLSALRPDLVQALSGALAHAAHGLQDLAGEERCPQDRAFRLAADAARACPDAESTCGPTAIGWALRLPAHQARGTLSLLLGQLPDRGAQASPEPGAPRGAHQSGTDAALSVVQGDRSAVQITASQAFCVAPATIGAPGLATETPGCWFFEVHVFGYSSYSVGAVGAAQPRTPCCFGWYSEGSQSRGLDGFAPGLCCTLEELVNDTTTIDRLLSLTLPGRNIVGCALGVSSTNGSQTHPRNLRAWFALDGNWGAAGVASWGCLGDGDAGAHGSRPSAAGFRGPVFPAASGCLACGFVFEPAHFVYGPPDSSFHPLAGAASAATQWPASAFAGFCQSGPRLASADGPGSPPIAPPVIDREPPLVHPSTQTYGKSMEAGNEVEDTGAPAAGRAGGEPETGV